MGGTPQAEAEAEAEAAVPLPPEEGAPFIYCLCPTDREQHNLCKFRLTGHRPVTSPLFTILLVT